VVSVAVVFMVQYQICPVYMYEAARKALPAGALPPHMAKRTSFHVRPVCRNISNEPGTLKRLWYTAVRSGLAIAECLQDVPLQRQRKNCRMSGRAPACRLAHIILGTIRAIV